MSDGLVHKVTVVIPAYKAERTIVRAIDSVIGQPGCSPSVIVIVDGRLDNTEDVVRSRYGDKVTLLVNASNCGVQYCRNIGLDLVSDEAVMFLDSDDFIEAPLLHGLADALVRNGTDIAFGRMRVFDERKSTFGPITGLVGSEQDIFANWLAEGKFVGTCSVMWRTQFLREIGAWDPAFLRQEDGELVLRALLSGARTARSEKGCGVYVMHTSPDRLTRRNDHLDCLLRVPAKLLAMNARDFPRTLVQNACAKSYYNAARTCYTRGARQLGRQALRESRALGFKGHLGNFVQRLSSALLGLPASSLLERGLRKVLGKSV